MKRVGLVVGYGSLISEVVPGVLIDWSDGVMVALTSPTHCIPVLVTDIYESIR